MDSEKSCLAKKNAVIGHPVAHSLSPVIHNAGYKALGLEGAFTYGYEEVDATTLEAFLARARTDYHGLSVTMPNKTAILGLIDEVEESAGRIGAVNTVVNHKGVLKGFNTDWEGIGYALSLQTTTEGKRIALFGAGGAARAALYALKDAKEIMIVNRDAEKAKALAKAFALPITVHPDLAVMRCADIIINAAAPTAEDFRDAALLNDGQVVFDMNYSPLRTPLITAAMKRGARTITGEKMLLGQAFRQFELFTGVAAPRDAMREALEGALREGGK